MRACTSEEELVELAKSEGYELPVDELVDVAGGRLKCFNYENPFPLYECPVQEGYAQRIKEIFGE